MGCLNDPKEELKAGKFAGQILCAKSYDEREELYLNVPEHLRVRVNEIMDHYEGGQVRRIGLVITGLKTKYERKLALRDVDEKIRERVKQFVIDRFEKKA
jgi:hypothetical protein